MSDNLIRSRNVVTPIPSNVEIRRNPIEEQLAHVLEIRLTL